MDKSVWLRYDKVDRGKWLVSRSQTAFTVKAVWLRETSTWQRCCVSAKFNEKFRGMCNYNPAFVVGSKNLRASSYKDHAATDMHKRALLLSRSRAPLMSQNMRLSLRPIQTIYLIYVRA